MADKRFNFKVRFKKSGDMIYFSQLDISRVLERALRRLNLPLCYTQGFRPHVKMSFSSALKLGREGYIEAVFYFSKKVDFKDIKKPLEDNLPKGLIIDRIISES